jgi:antibiotic biosynthesis monooxygenase (ABM) superfamily enzyme
MRNNAITDPLALKSENMMIRRMWHGWTTPERADAYQQLLREQIFPGILARDIVGLRGLEAWRRQVGEEIEFITVMTFEDSAAIAAFTMGDPARSVVPEAARELLARFDERSQHYDQVITTPSGGPPDTGEA